MRTGLGLEPVFCALLRESGRGGRNVGVYPRFNLSGAAVYIFLLVCTVSTASAQVTLSIPEVAVMPGDKGVVIPIQMDNSSGTVKGIQVFLEFDSMSIDITDVQVSQRVEHISSFLFNVLPNELRLVILDFGGNVVDEGAGPIAFMVIDVSDRLTGNRKIPLGFIRQTPAVTVVIDEHNEEYDLILIDGGLNVLSTDVVEKDDEPMKYALSQNYPNPFNPGTVIRYSIAEDNYVKLDVYDILGRLVVTLVDSYITAGFYSVNWDGKDSWGKDVASGVYIYRIRSGYFLSVRRMTLVR